MQGLSAWLRDKTALIELDSCEHVVGTAATLAEAVLKAAPSVSILTTSREPCGRRARRYIVWPHWNYRLIRSISPPMMRFAIQLSSCSTSVRGRQWTSSELLMQTCRQFWRFVGG